MDPTTSAALHALDTKLRTYDAMRKAIEARDLERARMVWNRMPSWAWPQDVAALLGEWTSEPPA